MNSPLNNYVTSGEHDLYVYLSVVMYGYAMACDLIEHSFDIGSKAKQCKQSIFYITMDCASYTERESTTTVSHTH